TDRGGPIEEEADQQEQHHAGDGNGAVLAVEVGARAHLDGARNFLHARVAGGLLHDPAGRDDAVENRNDRATQRDPYPILLQHRKPLSVLTPTGIPASIAPWRLSASRPAAVA